MKHLLLFLCLVTSVLAQPWAAPSGRSMPGNYSVGVGGKMGVDGGIPPRTDLADYINVNTHPSILADKTGATDARGPIESWLAAGNGSGKVIYFPAGTYKFDYFLALRSNMTFRGEVDANGNSLVTINSNGYGGFGGGDGANFANDATTKGKFSGSKGDTVITTYDLSGAYGSPVLEANRLITMNVDPADARRQIGYTRHPDIKNASWWVGYVKSVSGSNITVEPPLPYDVTEGTFALGYGPPVQNAGIENFIVNGQSPYSMQTGVIMQGNLYNTWVKNVKVIGQTNYGISYPIAVRYEIAHCEIAPAGAGSNHGGILIGNSTLGYIYDNIVDQNNPNTEFNFGFYGNIVAYNHLTGGTMNVNHGPLNLQNLYEGNYADGMQSDGYFGGAWWGEFYRNWLSGDGRAPIAMNRDAIEWMFVGNVFGQPGATSQYRPSSGNPNMGNGTSVGTRSTSGAKSTLTTRTSDSAGVITAPAGHGITTGATIDVYWMKTINSGGYDYPVAHIRYGMTVGTVSGTSIPVSGGLGDVLPTAASEIYVPVADANLAEYSISWDKTTGAIRTWSGTIATRPDDYNATVTIPDTTLLAANIAATNSGSALLSIYWTGANLGGYYCVASLSGTTLTINMPYGNILPATSTAVVIVPK